MTSPIRPRLLLAGLLLVPAAAFAGDAAAPQPPADPLVEARLLMSTGDYRGAIDSMENADRLAAGRCAECQLVVAEAHARLAERPAAAAAARAAAAGLADPQRIAAADALL